MVVGSKWLPRSLPSSASYFDIYKNQNEQSKINVHISSVE